MESRNRGGFKAKGDFHLRPAVEFVSVIDDVFNLGKKHVWKAYKKYAEFVSANTRLEEALADVQPLVIASEKSRTAFKAPEAFLSALNTAEENHRQAQQEIEDIESGEKLKQWEEEAKVLGKKERLERTDSLKKLDTHHKELAKQLLDAQRELSALENKKSVMLDHEVSSGCCGIAKKPKTVDTTAIDKDIEALRLKVAALQNELDAPYVDAQLDDLQGKHERLIRQIENFERDKPQLIKEAQDRVGAAKSGIENCHQAIMEAEDLYFCDITAANMHGVVRLYAAFLDYVNAFNALEKKNKKEDAFVLLLNQKKSLIDDLMAKLCTHDLGNEKLTAVAVMAKVNELAKQDRTHVLARKSEATALADAFNKAAQPPVVNVTPAAVVGISMFNPAGGAQPVNPLLLNTNNSNNSNNAAAPLRRSGP